MDDCHRGAAAAGVAAAATGAAAAASVAAAAVRRLPVMWFLLFPILLHQI